MAEGFSASASETALWLGVGLALFGLTLATAALRFHVLMRAADVPSSVGSAQRHLFIATFFNTVLPGGFMGDAWRIWEGHDQLRRGPAVLGVVALERLLGLQALGLVALIGAPWTSADALPNHVFETLVLVAITCAFGPFVLLLPAATGTVARLLDALPEHFSRVQRLAREVGDGVLAIRRHPTRAGMAIGLSLACQALPVVAVAALAVPLEGAIGLPWFAVIVPLVTLASMLPISVGGAGIRELLFVALLGGLGMPPEAALWLGLLTGLVNLAWAGFGGLLFTIGRRR